MKPVVRQAGPEDYAAVGELLLAAYSPSGMAADNPYWDSLRDVAGRATDAEVWVAEVDGAIVGTYTWAPRGSSQREIAQEDEAEFRMLAVSPGAQGRGVGRVLLEAVIERARMEGYAAVVLSSATWMTQAHALYARLGFRRTPDLDWSPMPGTDLLAYRLPLWGDAGTYLHGTKADLTPDDVLSPGYRSNYGSRRQANFIYVTRTLDAATWGAELAEGPGPARIYRVEPTGPLEDDPNVTDKRYPGNPTRSYRTRLPVRIIDEVLDWEPHAPEVVQQMRDHLAELERQGIEAIDD